MDHIVQVQRFHKTHFRLVELFFCCESRVLQCFYLMPRISSEWVARVSLGNSYRTVKSRGLVLAKVSELVRLILRLKRAKHAAVTYTSLTRKRRLRGGSEAVLWLFVGHSHPTVGAWVRIVYLFLADLSHLLLSVLMIMAVPDMYGACGRRMDYLTSA